MFSMTKTTQEISETAAGAANSDGERAVPNKIVWDDAGMQTSFANVINVLNTREEFTLLFGTNQSWNLNSSREVTVRLSNRIVLTPYAAKRLATLLLARVVDYEQRFGKMQIES